MILTQRNYQKIRQKLGLDIVGGIIHSLDRNVSYTTVLPFVLTALLGIELTDSLILATTQVN
jgi:hypothetical protein